MSSESNTQKTATGVVRRKAISLVPNRENSSSVVAVSAVHLLIDCSAETAAESVAVWGQVGWFPELALVQPGDVVTVGMSEPKKSHYYGPMVEGEIVSLVVAYKDNASPRQK